MDFVYKYLWHILSSVQPLNMKCLMLKVYSFKIHKTKVIYTIIFKIHATSTE